MFTEELNFDLTPQAVPVTLDGKAYTLREASEGDVIQWKNAGVAKLKIQDGKVTGLGAVADQDVLLVSLCLQDGAGKRVPVDTVRGWPTRVVTRLYKAVRRMSDLGDGADGKEEEAAKKSQAPTTDSSDSAAS